MNGYPAFLRRVRSEIDAAAERVFREAAGLGRSAEINFMGKAARTEFSHILGKIFGLPDGKILKIAVSAELMHTASLMHDDCIDEAGFRRGLPTVRKSIGTVASILLGDLIMAFSFETAERLNREIASGLINTAGEMTRGALMEESLRFRVPTLEEYVRCASLKTSSLFAWCATSLCYLSGKMENLNAAFKIARNAGIIFQITDDVLDFSAPGENSDKDRLKDIARGKITLPAILLFGEGGTLPGELLKNKNSGFQDMTAPLKIAGEIRLKKLAEKSREYARENFLKQAFAEIDALRVQDHGGRLKHFLQLLVDRTS